ncbi:MAG: ATP-dependent helicase HrpB [Gemmatimonadota bacterium]|nr:ATP-dependent helicase HrpB [Gemmatimonadota bacterium]
MKELEPTARERRFGVPLPVDEALPELRAALVTGTSAVLRAPPGAGKTTHVPIALLDEAWLGGSRILMLEPRRVAARAVTHRMAVLMGEKVGDTVGYRVRRDTKVGPRTRIEVVTEGVLTRMLQHDPTLEGVGLIIFDEFHERSIHADTGLALALHSRAVVRPDLRILVMSATLDGAQVASLLGAAPVITAEGRAFSVELVYGARPDSRSVIAAVASRVLHAVGEHDGDVLVFLPGGSEIRRVAASLEGRMPERVRIAQLYGDLSQQSQDDAIAPAPAGWRKVVLSTPIAETSLTIDGVTVVVDSGLARAPRFSPRTGMTRLEIVRISQSSANQRAGRAGRTEPGTCYRLWPEGEQHHLAPYSTPEILQADLAPLVLELAVAGVQDPTELAWLDVPRAAAWSQGRALLAMLGALDESGRITRHGRAMAAIPVHPRLAHMLIASREQGAGALACDIAALLEARDFLRGSNGPVDADIELRLQVLHSRDTTVSVHGMEIDGTLARRIRIESAALAQQLGAAGPAAIDGASPGVVLAFAYPDRIARARNSSAEGRFLLRNGSEASLTHPQALSACEFIVAANLDGDARSGRLFLGAALTRCEIEQYFADQIETTNVVQWDNRARVVRCVARSHIGAIVLKEASVTTADPEVVSTVLLDAIRREGVATLPWSDDALGTRRRIAFMRAQEAEWPDVSDHALEQRLEAWLGPLVIGVTSVEGLRVHLDRALLSVLDWRQREALERLAPSHYVAPTGTRVRIDYTDPASPSIAVRLQEMFGVRATPSVNGGRVALTVELLSPARQPVQVTRDLGGFWTGSYFEVRKQLRGRYPKHLWPDDPLTATPTTRARKRGT